MLLLCAQVTSFPLIMIVKNVGVVPRVVGPESIPSLSVPRPSVLLLVPVLSSPILTVF